MSLLIDILQPAPVSSIDEVLSIMTAIERRLPDSDGLKWFNRLYLRVTQSVRLAVAGRAFRDARFMSELDVVFANLYFAALAGAPLLRDEFFDRLDGLTEVAGKGLLVPRSSDAV